MLSWEKRLEAFEAEAARSEQGRRQLNTIELLRETLELAVTLKILELKARGGPSDFEVRTLHKRVASLGEKGAILIIKSQDGKKENKAMKAIRAEVFNDLVWGVSVAAILHGAKQQSFVFLGRDWAELA